MEDGAVEGLQDVLPVVVEAGEFQQRVDASGRTAAAQEDDDVDGLND